MDTDRDRDLRRALARAGIPLFAAADGCEAGEAARNLGGTAALRLGRLHRCARALAVSREPDLQYLLGHPVVVAPLAIEPADLPDPAIDFGERCLSVARECDESGLVGDVEDAFDAWLRQLELERAAAADA
jgi:hypothetical protein